MFAEDEARLLVSAARDEAELIVMVQRRVDGLPLEYVLGWAEFCGLRIAVAPGVFVPRRRTEFLVGCAVDLAKVEPGRAPYVVLDLCCGSGAMGAALAAVLDGIELHSADLDPAAVACARRNVEAAGGHVYEGDLYDPVPAAIRARIDLLVANAPYVPTEAVALMPPEARLHEHRVALDGGADGMDVLHRVIADAPDWLSPGGWVLVEANEAQTPALVGAMGSVGLIARVASDEESETTVVIGQRPAPPAGARRRADGSG